MSSHQGSNKCKDNMMKLMIKKEDFYEICQLLFDNGYRINDNIVFKKLDVRNISFDIL
jgi:hypothetical protein